MILKIPFDTKTEAKRSRVRKEHDMIDNPDFDFLIYNLGLDALPDIMENEEACDFIENLHKEAREKTKTKK